jgi:hypothetical protein
VQDETGRIIYSDNKIVDYKADKGKEFKGVTPSSWGSARVCKIKNGNISEI